MKILALVTDAFGGHGGIAKFNRDLLSALCAQPYVEQVTALPRLQVETAGELPPKLDYDTCGVGGKLRYALTVLRSAIANRQSQIILCGHINLLPVAYLAKLFLRAPVVLVIHGIDAWQPTRSRMANRLARKVDSVVSVSEFTRKKFWAWAQPEWARYFILPNCVDLVQFAPGVKSAELLRRYGLEGKTVMLTVARLSAAERYKGIDEVFEALPELAREIPDIAYLIVGDGDDCPRLKEKAAELGLKDRVVFAGRVCVEELPEHHRLADVYVMPGWGEGFGIVYLEALACDVPVVAGKRDASVEVVSGCTAAVTADAGSPAELRAAILAALGLPRAGAGRAFVEKYSQENFNCRCVEFLRKTI